MADFSAIIRRENLHGAGSEAHLDFTAAIAVRNAVEVLADVNVIVDADATQAPFGEHVRRSRQWLEMRPIEFLEQLPSSSRRIRSTSLT